MMTVKFENACAAPRRLPMENPGKGLLVLHLPGIDVDTPRNSPRKAARG